MPEAQCLPATQGAAERTRLKPLTVGLTVLDLAALPPEVFFSVA